MPISDGRMELYRPTLEFIRMPTRERHKAGSRAAVCHKILKKIVFFLAEFRIGPVLCVCCPKQELRINTYLDSNSPFRNRSS